MESRKVYAFVLCVGGEIKQLITTLSCEETDVVKFLHGMRKAAGLFKKTAAILAYTHKIGERWTFANARGHCDNIYLLAEITITHDRVILYD